MNKAKRQIKWIFLTGIIMVLGLILLKYIPMEIYGKDILFDASSHVVWTAFVIYIGWFFVDQSKNLRILYLILSVGILAVISLQRIIANEHNEVGIILGFFVAFLGVVIPRWKEFMRNIKF
jgi:hypothetical protein